MSGIKTARGDPVRSLLAFLLGTLGAGVCVLLLWVAEESHRHIPDLLHIAIFLGLPLLTAAVWSAFVAWLTPTVNVGIASAGYGLALPAMGMVAWGWGGLVLAPLSLFCLITGRLGAKAALWGYSEPPACPEEPACPYCGYGLYYAREHACPDCGRPFRSADVDMRLAHWEDGVLKPWKGAGPAPLDRTLYDPLTSAPARSAKYDVPRRWEVPGYWSMYCRQLGDDWRALARQLRARPQFPHALWQEQGVSPELAEKILSFMVKALQWPNHYFAPHDPMWLVLLPVALDACDFAELVLVIGEEFGVTITDETVTQLYKREAPVVDFVRMIEAGMTGQHD